MKKIFAITFLLCASLLSAQNIEKPKPIYGQLISDSINVKSVNIVNRTLKVEAVTSSDGSFTINANPKDTLYFDSSNIITMQYVVEPIDFKAELKVNVYPKSTLLEEIVIFRHDLTGTLGYDARSLPTYYRDLDAEIKDKVTGLDLTSEEQNSRILVRSAEQAMSGNIKTDPYSMNFVAIGTAVGKLFKKSSKVSERQKVQNQVYATYGKNNLAEQLQMSTIELDYYLDFLIAKNILNNKKVENYDSLVLLGVMIDNKTSYYSYLEQEIK